MRHHFCTCGTRRIRECTYVRTVNYRGWSVFDYSDRYSNSNYEVIDLIPTRYVYNYVLGFFSFPFFSFFFFFFFFAFLGNNLQSWKPWNFLIVRILQNCKSNRVANLRDLTLSFALAKLPFLSPLFFKSWSLDGRKRCSF